MDLNELSQLRRELKDCDYQLAAQVLIRHWQGSLIQNELADVLTCFLSNPCFDAALPLLEFEPLFVVYFSGCQPGGTFARRAEKGELPDYKYPPGEN